MTALAMAPARPVANSARLPAQTPVWPGGTATSALLSALFAALLGSGLVLEWGPGGQGRAALTLLHLVAGGAFLGLFAPWALRHVAGTRVKSQRALFTWLGWALLAKFVLVLATGLAMALPPALWLVGQVWFWPIGATRLMAFLHLWLSLASALGLGLHLTLRHWRTP